MRRVWWIWNWRMGSLWMLLGMYTVGDLIHSLREERVHADGLIGQFYDMLHLYSLTGEPSDKHCLLMNGDLVDRGSWSIEVILTAFAYKCKQAQLNYQCRRTNFLYYRAIPQEDVHQSRKSWSEGYESDLWVRGWSQAQAWRTDIQGRYFHAIYPHLVVLIASHV